MTGKNKTRARRSATGAPASDRHDISTPNGRRRAWLHYHLLDHGFLRTLWTNFDEVAPGVWRSNQPSPSRLKRYCEMGIHRVLNLRGRNELSYYLFEREAAARLGIELIDLPIYAKRASPRQNFIDLLDVFDCIERPFLMHCKSGADRTGIAAAFWLIHIEGRPIAEARKQLGLRYVHLRSGKAGLVDLMLDQYERQGGAEGRPLRDWIEKDYDPAALEREHRQGNSG